MSETGSNGVVLNWRGPLLAAAIFAAAFGILLLMGGNLTLSWAELSVPSGLAALIIAITPLWFLVLDSLLLGDHHISGRGKTGLALGLAGLFVLVWPDLQAGSLGRKELFAPSAWARSLGRT